MENLLASGRVYRELEGTGSANPATIYIMSQTAVAKVLRPSKLKRTPRTVAAAF
jgi:hypothetical protein